MGMPVRIDDDLCEQAKVGAAAEYRTIASQIEFWVKVGRVAIDNPHLLVGFCVILKLIKKDRGEVDLATQRFIQKTLTLRSQGVVT